MYPNFSKILVTLINSRNLTQINLLFTTKNNQNKYLLIHKIYRI